MKNILNKISAFFKSTKSKVSKCKVCEKLKLSKLKLPKIKLSLKWFKENKIISIGFIAVLIAFLFGYVLKGFFVAALVNGKPISRLRVVRELEKTQGLGTLDSIITEELIRQEARKAGIKISKEDVDAEITSIETSLKNQSQNLDDILVAQGMTRKDLIKNIELQKMIENILASKSSVTDADVQKYIEENKDSFPEGTNMEEVKSLIKQQLVQQKISTEFQSWIDSVKSTANINIIVKY